MPKYLWASYDLDSRDAVYVSSPAKVFDNVIDCRSYLLPTINSAIDGLKRDITHYNEYLENKVYYEKFANHRVKVDGKSETETVAVMTTITSSWSSVGSVYEFGKIKTLDEIEKSLADLTKRFTGLKKSATTDDFDDFAKLINENLNWDELIPVVENPTR